MQTVLKSKTQQNFIVNIFGESGVLKMSNPKFNSEGYYDPTAYEGLKPIIKEEAIQQKRVSELVQVLKYIIDKAGFVMVNRVALKDKESGKEYR